MLNLAKRHADVALASRLSDLSNSMSANAAALKQVILLESNSLYLNY